MTLQTTERRTAPTDGPRAAGAQPAADRAPGTLPSLRTAGERGWQVVGVALALVAVGLGLQLLVVPVVAVLLALLLASITAPVVQRLVDRGWRRSIAAFAVTVAWLAGLVAALGLLGMQVAEEVPQLADQLSTAVDRLAEQVPALPADQLDPSSLLAGGEEGTSALSGIRAGAEVVTALVLAVVLSFFFVRDGARMWSWCTRLAQPGRPRDATDRMGRAAFGTVSEYVRGLAVVALADAVLSGLGLFVLGVPLAAALTALTFFAAFVPTIGALVVGALAVALAFAEGGTALALWTLLLYTAVQQVDSNVLQPWIMGHRLPLHPAVVLLALTVGGVTAGVVGALLAVPVAAALVAAARERARLRLAGHDGPGDPEDEGAFSPAQP